MLSRLKKVVVGVARELKKTAVRSPEWPTVRRKHLEKNPKCAACGGTRLCQVHHKKPFHLDPALELDPENLITLCIAKLCHIDIGHGDDYKAYNPNVEKDAALSLQIPEKRAQIEAQAKAARLYAEPPKPTRS
jgi:hypothetical protein